MQEIILARAKRYTDEEMLEKFREILRNHGRISGVLIDEREDMPSSAAFRNRFGSLVRAYQLIGYTPETDYFHPGQPFPAAETSGVGAGDHHEAGRAGRDRRPRSGHRATHARPGVDGFARALAMPAHYSRRCAPLGRAFEESLRPDITIVARMDEANQAIMDYYLFPAIDRVATRMRLAEDNQLALDCYRFDDLEFFFDMAERISIEEVA